MKNWFLVTFFFLTVSSVFAQGKITGIVYDENGPLPGANIVIEGTTVGVVSDFDGTFSLNSAAASGKVVISFLGFATKKVEFSVANGKTADLGTIVLSGDENVLGEIVVKSTVVDIAKDRKTPVAVSTIKGSEIKEKLGSQEFPEVLANTPSVYATKSGGGFGDSRINIRGFSQENIAVMINGVPVNDMENSRVFWSNWAGLSDVTSAMQVQRGLGSSKLAISSVGGTINIVTRTADIKQGGSVSAMLGNDDYFKTLASYSTGKMKNGLSASVLFSNTQGNGYVNGTKFLGQNYFVGVGYEINDKHDVQLTFTGAPQWHNQRSAAPTIATYMKYGQGGEPNIRYNSDWGYLNGKEYSFRTNYYHKPVASFNYDWKINDGTKISTVLYGSWGRGGGSNGAGAIRGNRYFDPNLRTPNGTVNVDLIQEWNSGNAVVIAPSGSNTAVSSVRTPVNGAFQNSSSTSNNLTNGISKISSINSHNWYGGVINLNKKLTDKLTLDFGLDARTYRGIHFQNVNDLLGATNYSDNFNVNNINPVTGVQIPRVLYGEYAAEPNGNPFFNSDYQEKINYNNDGLVRWYGAFTQLEYTTEKLTAFIQGAVSQQGFKRVDYFKYLSFDPLSSTKYERILGGNVKGGANYNINDKHNVFVNAGYYSKQPFFNAVYPVNTSKLNEDLTNEKILGIEVGYGFRSAVFNANLNLYRTTWDDRFLNSSTANVDPDDNPATNNSVRSYAFMSGVNQIHQGVELDFTVKPFSKLTFNGMFSYGDWNYGDSVVKSSYFREDNNLPLLVPVTPAQPDPLLQKKTEQNISGLKVGDAAQMTASLGAAYEVVEGLKLDANYRYTDRLFASFEPSRFTTQALVDKGSLELPAYGLMDAGISYKMMVGKDKSNSVNLRLNVNNVLDEIYIAESRTNVTLKNQTDFITAGSYNVPAYQAYQATGTYDGVDKANEVFFGFGRTWNFSVSYNF